jgi:hypothetical protein
LPAGFSAITHRVSFEVARLRIAMRLLALTGFAVVKRFVRSAPELLLLCWPKEEVTKKKGPQGWIRFAHKAPLPIGTSRQDLAAARFS